MASFVIILTGLTIGGGVMALMFWSDRRQLKRAEFINNYTWPPGLLDKLKVKHPYFMRKEASLVQQGLRQFFLAYLNGGRKYVAMPSQVADDLWHDFILYTRAYDDFCKKAFGEFLHHTPALALEPGRKQDNSGLRRVWWQTCKLENIDPKNPSRLPLLFALDKKLRVPGGFYYTPNCEELRKNGVAGTQCGGDFSSPAYDGGTDGYGVDGSGDGSDGGGGGDGGGCGGGD